MKKVLLKNLRLGDVDDVEIYAGAAIWEWMKTPDFEMLKAFKLSAEDMYWTSAVSYDYGGNLVQVWVNVPVETEILLKLSGLCQQ